jgi:voltage-gated potassium channel Kch
MNGRGAVEIILAEIALAQGLIDRDIFSILVFMALFTTATVPVLLTAGVRWLRRRGELVKASGRDRILVIGADPVVRALASNLGSEKITMVDTNRQNLLEAERLEFTTLQGNALEEAILETAGIDESSLVIAATPNAEVNVLVAQLSRELGVPEVAVLLTEDEANTLAGRLAPDDIEIVRMPNDAAEWAAAALAGLTTVVSLDLTGPDFDEDTLPDNSPVGTIGAPLLPLVVVRKGERQPFTGQDDLKDAEKLICLSREPQRREAEAGEELSGR